MCVLHCLVGLEWVCWESILGRFSCHNWWCPPLLDCVPPHHLPAPRTHSRGWGAIPPLQWARLPPPRKRLLDHCYIAGCVDWLSQAPQHPFFSRPFPASQPFRPGLFSDSALPEPISRCCCWSRTTPKLVFAAPFLSFLCHASCRGDGLPPTRTACSSNDFSKCGHRILPFTLQPLVQAPHLQPKTDK